MLGPCDCAPLGRVTIVVNTPAKVVSMRILCLLCFVNNVQQHFPALYGVPQELSAHLQWMYASTALVNAGSRRVLLCRVPLRVWGCIEAILGHDSRLRPFRGSVPIVTSSPDFR